MFPRTIPYHDALTVVWRRTARNQLAEIWFHAEDRQAVTDPADIVDAELKINADAKGYDSEDGMRIFIVPPIEVLFKVIEPDRLVKVVWIQRLNGE